VPEQQIAQVVRMKAVNILRRIDAFEHRVLGNCLGQRKLNKDAVDGVVFVQTLDFGDQRFRVDRRSSTTLRLIMPICSQVRAFMLT
jgi:hypothetical protein